MLFHESNIMTDSIKNIAILLLIGIGLFLLTKIQLLIIYLFISLVISITINPLSNWLCGITILKKSINKTISTILCLFIVSTFTFTTDGSFVIVVATGQWRKDNV